jgi:hypothetical protein
MKRGCLMRRLLNIRVDNSRARARLRRTTAVVWRDHRLRRRNERAPMMLHNRDYREVHFGGKGRKPCFSHILLSKMDSRKYGFRSPIIFAL